MRGYRATRTGTSSGYSRLYPRGLTFIMLTATTGITTQRTLFLLSGGITTYFMGFLTALLASWTRPRSSAAQERRQSAMGSRLTACVRKGEHGVK